MGHSDLAAPLKESIAMGAHAFTLTVAYESLLLE